ncbi:MAG: helix-turn-helix domain-containing protein [Labedaea sp.]
MTARGLLAWVLREARQMLDHSPEHVATAVGLSPRTVRRLEDPDEPRQPRAATLRPLTRFLGLDEKFIEELASWGETEGAELRTRLRDRTADLMEDEEPAELAGAPDELRLLAMRAARGRGPRQAPAQPASPFFGPNLDELLVRLIRTLDAEEHDELAALLDGYASVDRRRRRMLVDLARDLRAGRERELGL